MKHRWRWLGVKVEPRDLWIGLYWTKERHLINYPVDDDDPRVTCMELTFYVCIIPVIVVKFRYYYGARLGF